MKRAPKTTLTLVCLLMLAALALLPAACQRSKPLNHFGGGPTGSTLHHFGEALVEFLNEEDLGRHLVIDRSGGSLANLTGVNEGNLDMALVYAGDAALGERGALDQKLPPTNHVLALARLYGAPAHLVVRQTSTVMFPFDLKKRRVAIGNPGSGAALAAERYFRALGLWRAIIPVYLGSEMALEDLNKGAVDAVWDQSGSPSAVITAYARRYPVRLLDLQSGAFAGGLFEKYPFYTATHIPGGTYFGQDQDVATFQDAALWVANARVDGEFVYQALDRVFSPEGLARLLQIDGVSRGLSQANALYGVHIPLHPGARRFWSDRGLIGAASAEGGKTEAAGGGTP